ncbi:MAG: SpoIIE family protein phosphatase [Bdellovibrionales bacterium]|nr:SpoIIE family protein phosphatase [Bdellovibrionales bacterium]
MSESQEWKQKFEELSALLQEKEQALKEYRQIIEQSNQMIKEVMDKLSVELKMAHQIHRVLLPVDLPVISNCEFSFKFRPASIKGESKDFYEVLPHLNKKFFNIIMSSCSSHALSALLFSARLKMMSRGEKVNQLQPHEFMVRLSEEISSDTSHLSAGGISISEPLKEKVALFYAFIDQKTYQMSYCLVGDIVALVQYAETGEIETLSASAYSLEKKEIRKLKTDRISLNGKDRFILCSPGVLQCQSPGGDIYSLSALKGALQNKNLSSVHEIRNRILYDLESFAQGRPTERDQSVLVMEVKRRILKLAKF